MATPIKKVLVSEFQARKISTGNQTVIIQIRRKAGEPVRKFKAKLCDLEEIRPPFLEPLVGQGIIRPVDAIYEQFVEEIIRRRRKPSPRGVDQYTVWRRYCNAKILDFGGLAPGIPL